NEPDLLDYQVYMDDEQSEVTFILVFRGADAADHHMQVAGGELIGRGLEITSTSRLEVYGGTPGPVLGGVLAANAGMGVPVTIKAQPLGGVRRTRSARAPSASSGLRMAGRSRTRSGPSPASQDRGNSATSARPDVAGGGGQGSRKLHSPGHSSAASIVMSSMPAGTVAMPCDPWGLPFSSA